MLGFRDVPVATLLLTGSLLASAPAAAQTAPIVTAGVDAPGARLTLLLETGFGGEAELEGGGGSFAADLDPSVGVGARFAVPVHEHVLVGGEFDLIGFETDAGSDRDLIMDVDGYVAGRYVMDAGGHPLELYVGIPFGLSIGFADDNTGSDETWPGWNIGVLGGGQLWFGSFGLLAEIGFRHHHLYNEFGGVEVDLSTTQFTMHFGASYAFD